MRKLLFAAVLGLCSLNAVADANWKSFPQDQSAYDYSGDKLRSAWPQLTRGFGHNYPFPDAAWVAKTFAQNPKALDSMSKDGSQFSGKPAEAEAYANKLQDVWRLMFRGDFAQAKADGLKLGIGGQVPAMFAQVIYALFLAPDQASKQQLLEEVISYTDKAGAIVNADPMAMFGRVYAKARLGEDLPIAIVLKRGYTSQIPNELDELLKKSPNQPYALALYGGYHAGVIRKVGSFVGGITYGVGADKMEQFFARSFKQANNLPIGHYEYANALTYVYGDDEHAKALEQLKLAAAIKPINAMEALEVAHAKKLLTSFQKSSAQR